MVESRTVQAVCVGRANVTEPNVTSQEQPTALPGLDLSSLPVRVDRRAGADLITRYLFPVSPRTIESWCLTTRRVNGRAVYETRELLDHARAMLDASPAVRGGRKRKDV